MSKNVQEWRSYAKRIEVEGDELRAKLEQSFVSLAASDEANRALAKAHLEQIERLTKLHDGDTSKLRKENDDLREALKEIMPVLRRLLDWKIESPLA